MYNERWHARYWDLEASFFGALFVAFAAGAFASTWVMPIAAWLVVIGLPLHAWGMFRVYRQNPGPPVSFRHRLHF